MVFDPSSIKKRPLPQPTGSREERILALAKQLEERGLASSASAAKRLAEGMVDTERKVISGGRQGDEFSERERFQRDDSPLFRAVGGKEQRTLDLPEDFQAFVKKATALREALPPAHVPEPSVASGPPKPAMSDEAPEKPVNVGDEHWEVPSRSSEGGYTKTMVEASQDGVVVRHVDAQPNEDTVAEEGVVRVDEPEEAAEEQESTPEPKREDLAKKHGIDLFDIFKSG